LLRQRIGQRVGEIPAAARLDHDAADVAGYNRVQRPVGVQVIAGIGEVLRTLPDE
jgi:hypothetical protein